MSYETRVPVIIKPEYIVKFQRFNNETWIHCDVFKWTPTIRNNLKADFEKLVSIHSEPILATHEIGDSKHLKFLNLFGFKKLRDIKTLEGKDVEIFIRS